MVLEGTLLKFRTPNGAQCRIWCEANNFFWKNNVAISNGIHKVINHAQARDGLCLLVKSVASGMLTLKKFCAAVKALIIAFFQKNFFLPYA